MAILLLIAGLVLAGLAAGFLLAVSFGIRQRDRKGGYRSLRDDPEDGALARSGRRIVGLDFPVQRDEEDDPRPRTAARG